MEDALLYLRWSTDSSQMDLLDTLMSIRHVGYCPPDRIIKRRISNLEVRLDELIKTSNRSVRYSFLEESSGRLRRTDKVLDVAMKKLCLQRLRREDGRRVRLRQLS